MVQRVLLILCLLHACAAGQEPSREALLSWFRERLLEGLALEEPPAASLRSPGVDVAQPEARHMHRRVPRTSRASWASHQTRPSQEMSQIILFPSSDSSCARSSSGPESHFTYHFQPSMNNQESQVTSAHFWFYAGEEAAVNSSAELIIVTWEQQLLQAAQAPSATSSDGWTTYHLDHSLLPSVAEGAFLLQVRCPTCQCHTSEPDKMPFLHLHAQPRGPARSPRHAPVTIPWSPSAVDLLQRPSQERPQPSDCRREAIQISFEELGWENWIVHPKLLTFFYCHGNCSALDRTTTRLGITQCCAPVPGSMRSLRITTTSDGGYSFKYETLPNIMPEDCACI